MQSMGTRRVSVKDKMRNWMTGITTVGASLPW
jgi:hypothetical protein